MQRSAFTPAENDYLFMPELDDQIVHDEYARRHWQLEYERAKRKILSLGQFGVLNSSINSKLKLDQAKRGIRLKPRQT